MKYLFAFIIALSLPLSASAATEYFGNFTTAGSEDTLNSNQLVCTPVTSPADAGTLTSISLYWDAANASLNVKYVIYSSTGTFLAASSALSPAAPGWSTSTISYVMSPSTTYCLGLIFATGGTAANQYDLSTTRGNADNGGTNSYSSPTNASFTIITNYSQTIYAAYTPAGGAPVKVPDPIFWGWW